CSSLSDLRSFPTRRSSDLGWLELFVASPLFNSGDAYLPDSENYVHFASADPNRWAIAAATNKKFIEEYGGGTYYDLYENVKDLWRASNEYNQEVIWDRDRKSTRLNSSHVKISYAVFCLKKKKTRIQSRV